MLSPGQLLITLPELVVNLFSDQRQQGRVEDTHYASALIPFVSWSALLGTAWLLEQARRALEKMERGAWAKYAAVALFSGLLVWGGIYHYYRGFSPLSRGGFQAHVDAHTRRVPEFAALVPATAPILAQPNLGPFFSQRRQVYSNLRALPEVDYLFVDVRHPARNRGAAS